MTHMNTPSPASRLLKSRLWGRGNSQGQASREGVANKGSPAFLLLHSFPRPLRRRRLTMTMAWTQVVVAVCLVAAAETQQECRVCPEGCQTVPRADGSCGVCICDGVALTDCQVPLECPESCPVERGVEGCLQCSCVGQDALCRPLGACPEECQQLVADTGCPECICEEREALCPPLQCPEGCTLEEEEGGCPSCRCNAPRVCPAIPECLRGCIDRDEERDCYFCNCAVEPDQPLEGGVAQPQPAAPALPDQRPPDDGVIEDLPGEFDPVDAEPVEPVEPIRPEVDPACGDQRLECAAGCRIGTDANGCRRCYCGTNAMICPGVRRCNSRCQYRSPEDGCCRCQCAGPASRPGLRVTLRGLTPVSVGRIFSIGRARGRRGQLPFTRIVLP
ncbi:uncharacterized protein DDB_G0274171-like [Scylla paramamosain]|uniref:uncharacterized protein DDB_G0274171-like n=1 Tax=Scylla paramamosain TaxID=85552 RepID=UPI0030829B4D